MRFLNEWNENNNKRNFHKKIKWIHITNIINNKIIISKEVSKTVEMFKWTVHSDESKLNFLIIISPISFFFVFIYVFLIGNMRMGMNWKNWIEMRHFWLIFLEAEICGQQSFSFFFFFYIFKKKWTISKHDHPIPESKKAKLIH